MVSSFREWKGCLFWKYSLQALCILICHFLQLYSAKTAKQLFPYLSVLLLIMKTIILFRLYCSANIFQILGSIVPGSNTNNKANDLHQSERNKYFEWMILRVKDLDDCVFSKMGKTWFLCSKSQKIKINDCENLIQRNQHFQVH